MDARPSPRTARGGEYQRRGGRTFVYAAALGLALAIVAALQYRWAGEVSRLERDRLARATSIALQRFAAGFDAEPEAKWTYFGPTESSWNFRDDRMISCRVVTSGAQVNQIEQPSPPPSRERRELEGMVGQ